MGSRDLVLETPPPQPLWFTLFTIIVTFTECLRRFLFNEKCFQVQINILFSAIVEQKLKEKYFGCQIIYVE